MRSTTNSTPDRAPAAPERGFAMIVVLFLVILVVGLSIGLVEESLAARSSILYHESNLRALAILEAGVARAAQEVRADVDYGNDGLGAVSGSLGGGTYSVMAVRDAVNPDRFTLSARGIYRNSERRVHVGLRRRERRMFVEGLFSAGDLDIGGNVETDAYDSSLGPYALQAVNVDAYGTYARTGGSIGTNAGIHLHGSSAAIRGNAIPGPLQEIDASGNPVVTGDQLPREFEMDLDPTPFSEFQAAFTTNNNSNMFPPGPKHGMHYDPKDKDLHITGGAILDLPAGTYFFRNLTITGNATLAIAAGVKIYITGDFDASGGSVVNAGRPQDFQVYQHPYPLPSGFTPTSSSMKLRGGSQLAMAFYGPSADLSLGGGIDYFGAAVAKTIKVGGDNGDSAFHYDVSLRGLGSKSITTLEQLWWREPSPPRR
jgi:hypothetical protein